MPPSPLAAPHTLSSGQIPSAPVSPFLQHSVARTWAANFLGHAQDIAIDKSAAQSHLDIRLFRNRSREPGEALYVKNVPDSYFLPYGFHSRAVCDGSLNGVEIVEGKPSMMCKKFVSVPSRRISPDTYGGSIGIP